jgi:hypothetical protein
MADVKSAIELAMERTKHLVPTREEREELGRREAEKRARALVRRALEGELAPGVLQRELHALESDEPNFLSRETACRECLLGAQLHEKGDRAIEVLRGLSCEKADALGDLLRRYRASEEALSQTASERLLAELQAAGISGPSVIPNPESDPEWREGRARLQDAFEGERDRLASA